MTDAMPERIYAGCSLHGNSWGVPNSALVERLDNATEYIRADVAAAQLAERDAKLQAIRDVVHRWIDNKQGSSPDSMLRVLEILYPPPPPVTADTP